MKDPNNFAWNEHFHAYSSDRPAEQADDISFTSALYLGYS